MGLFDKLFGRKSAPAPQGPDSPAAAQATDGQDSGDWADAGTPQELQAAEVRERLDGENPPILLDVREHAELRADGWLPGAVHIPMGELESRVGELDKSRPVVVYCASGMRSFDAGFLLIEQGFRDVANLNGGIRQWDGEVEREG